jgi:predicted ATPase/DNA-binding SARP family transcriptional activator
VVALKGGLRAAQEGLKTAGVGPGTVHQRRQQRGPAQVQFRILGPLEVLDDGRPLTLGGAKQRALLAVLLLHAGQVMAVERLIDELWGEDPPERAAHILQVHVANLRKALEPTRAPRAASGVLRTRPPGYLAEPGPEALDLARFERLAAEGRAALTTDDAEQAASLLRSALRLWRGPALADVVLAASSQGEVARLEERRLGVLEQRIEVDLALGRHAELVSELQALVAAHPLRERLRGQLLLAMYRSDRQAEALEVYQQTREVLAGELGIDPSPQLQELQRAVLVQDPALNWVAPPGLEGSAQGRASATRSLRPDQRVVAGLSAKFPPPETRLSRPTNLPAQPTPLLGRERELKAITGLLGRDWTRLMTLTGPGGSGKTRLALQAAAEALDDFPDGVFFVSLAAITDPSLVVATVAQTLGVREGPGRTIEESLREHLEDKQLLLLLDNFEQVVEAAPKVFRLLAACPRLKVLVTSREPLHAPGEQQYPVPPLPVPDQPSLQRPDPLLLSQFVAVALFVERAQAVNPAFQITDENAQAVGEVCVRLDGLPLAIELAAARSKLLPPQAILRRLGQRLKLLTGGVRGVPARQQTLRNTIDWSYELLPEGERALFARLAVFVGGCSLEAAEAVCDPGGELGIDVLDGMASLVDKSLIRQQERAEGEPRFEMLETVREYALVRLEADRSAQEVRRRHSEYFVQLAEQARDGLEGPHQQRWLERLEEEHANLRAVLARLLDQRRTEHAMRVVSGMWSFWLIRGHLREGQRWSEEVLGQADPSPSLPLRGDVLAILGEFYRYQGDYARSIRVKEEALPILRHTDPRLAAGVLHDLGEIAAQAQGQYARALELHEESLALRRQLGDQGGIAHALTGLADLAVRTGDLTHAAALYERVLQTASELQDAAFTSFAMINLAHIARLDANGSRAAAWLRDGLALAQKRRDLYVLVDGLEEAAAIAAGQDEASHAARLFGAAAAIREGSGLLAPLFPDDRAQNLAQVHDQLGEDFPVLWNEGRAMPLEHAVTYALEIIAER